MCVMIEDCGIHTHRHTQKDTIHKLCFVYWGESLGAVTVEGIPVLGTACLMRSIGADCIIGGKKNLSRVWGWSMKPLWLVAVVVSRLYNCGAFLVFSLPSTLPDLYT